MQQQKRHFTKAITEWYEPDQRPLPWKAIKNPYHIWLSEIILQQTRVEQGMPYYLNFIEQYPTVIDLAQAEDDAVMKLWEGLGYYSRARNMLFAARHIVDVHQGQFPTNYKDILALKGVGPYTAAAIASFAYNLPHAVVDGNVYRVLARFFGIDLAIDSTPGKKTFAQLAQDCLDTNQPGRYNQAIMDFGATVCTPKNPSCIDCPLQNNCIAFADQRIQELPFKAKKIKKRQRFFYYLDIESDQGIIIHKRIEKDIWQALYQFPLIETSEDIVELSELEQEPLWKTLLPKGSYQLVSTSQPYQQMLTHQKIRARYLKIHLKDPVEIQLPEPYFFHPKSQLKQFAFPKIFDCYLEDNSLYLNL
ncbi:MAG: A/G-specific adenine glycosylase [Saprospiraceae bacterium]